MESTSAFFSEVDIGPCLLINEKLHKCVRAADVPTLLADANNQKISMPRSDLFDAPNNGAGAPAQTSDAREAGEAE